MLALRAPGRSHNCLPIHILLVFIAVTLGTVRAATAGTQLYPEFLGAFFPSRMNEPGQIIGNAEVAGNQRGFVVTPGQAPHYLPLPSGMVSAWAQDLNDLGVIVGRTGPAFSPEFGGRPVVWEPDGLGGYSVRILDALPGQTQGSATAINNVGDIVGWSSDGMFRYAVLFQESGSALGLGGTGIFDPTDINDQRVLVDNSFTVKRLDLDTMVAEDLGHPGSGYVATRSVRINEAGQVAGQAIRSTSQDADREAARYTDGVGWETYGGPGPRNGVSDLNEHGDMVLTIYTESYVRYEGLGIFRIEDLVVNDVGTWEIGYNFGLTMNSAGWIAVYATNTTTGESGTLLLRPDAPAGVETVATDPPRIAAFPNPFRDEVHVLLEAPADRPGRVGVYDASGRFLREVGAVAPGSGSSGLVWDGRDRRGTLLPSGTYYVVLETARGRASLPIVRIP